MKLKDKIGLYGDDWDVWEEEYEEKKHELISNLQIATLSELLGDLENGIVKLITDSVIMGLEGQKIGTMFFFQVKYALEHFIIVERDTKEHDNCMQRHGDGEVEFCKFDGWQNSNYAAYYEI